MLVDAESVFHGLRPVLAVRQSYTLQQIWASTFEENVRSRRVVFLKSDLGEKFALVGIRVFRL